MYQNGKILLLFVVSFSIFIGGCSKHDPNPELRDPIFLDLKDRVGDLNRDVNSLKATVEEEQAKVESSEPRSKDLALARKRLREAKIKLGRAEQELRYFEIRLERRKLESRLAYEKAFSADRPWPDKKEFEAYEANKELKSAQSSWSSRVPKLKDRIKEYNARQATN